MVTRPLGAVVLDDAVGAVVGVAGDVAQARSSTLVRLPRACRSCSA